MANGTPQQPQPVATEADTLLSFRDSIDDLIIILDGLGSLYTDIDEMVESLQLAKKNDGQARLLMSKIMPTRLRKP